MRALNEALFSATNNAGTQNSAAVDVSQLTKMSVQAMFTDGAAAGTLKVQVSNDHTAQGNIPATFTVSNWNDLTGASVVVAAGATSLIPTTNLCYQWMRLVWTSTGGAGTFTATVKAQDN